MTTSILSLLHVENTTHRGRHLIHRLDALSFLWYINIAQIPRLVALNDGIKSLIIDLCLCKTKSTTCMRWCHNSIVVNRDLINSIVHFGTLTISEQDLAKYREFWWVASFSIPY